MNLDMKVLGMLDRRKYNIRVSLVHMIHETLVASAKLNNRSKTAEARLRLEDHLKKFPKVY